MTGKFVLMNTYPIVSVVRLPQNEVEVDLAYEGFVVINSKLGKERLSDLQRTIKVRDRSSIT